MFLIIFALSCKNKTVEDEFLEACFSVSKTTFTVGEIIYFNNCSSGAESYLWDFGDGFTTKESYPQYSYKEPGMYSVQLTAIGTKTRKTFTTVLYIN